MAKNIGKGKGWHGDPEGHAKAGEKGGEALAWDRGEEYFSEFGRKGGQFSRGNAQEGNQNSNQGEETGWFGDGETPESNRTDDDSSGQNNR